MKNANFLNLGIFLPRQDYTLIYSLDVYTYMGKSIIERINDNRSPEVMLFTILYLL